MPTKEIFKLLDSKILVNADIQHCIFMWTVDEYLFECEEYMKQRNYKRHCRLIWDKTNGIAPAFTIRFTHEYLIWYYKPKLISISTEYRGKFRTVFIEKSRAHSRKPDFAYWMVDQLYPNTRKIDVFSREKRVGWEQFGNEPDFFN